jgi:hypothetical protein
MPLNADVCNQQLDASLSSIVMLNASCQAVVEAEIQEVESSWYGQLDQELGQAENLVLAWRRSGVLYFQSAILDTVGTAGQAFISSKTEIDALFALLINAPLPATQTKLIAALQALQSPVQALAGQTDDYLAKLKAFETSMGAVQQNMQTTVAQVQQQETQIQIQINALNTEIASLKQQIQTDRDANRPAESQRTSGILETIFGIVLAPVTGGASLILAGIGVASISEAESKIADMQSQISSYQQTITGDQANLTSDQQIVATLQGLTMSTGIVLDDIAQIQTALDALRTSWTAFSGELGGVIGNLQQSISASVVVVSEAWYDAACNEWSQIVQHVGELSNQPINSSRIQIG